MALCRIRTGARKRQAIKELRRVLGRFTRGAQTGDLRAAKILIAG